VGKLRYNSQLSLSAKKEEHNELHIAYHEERYQISVLLKAGVNQGVANDVGFITLPDGRRFAIAVFTNSVKTANDSSNHQKRSARYGQEPRSNTNGLLLNAQMRG
jgi:hypothetical protein